MSNPSKHDIARAVLELSRSIAEDRLAREVAAYLIAERRSGELESIMREVSKLRQRESDITEVTVTSARPITTAVKNQVRDLIGKNIRLNEVIDKSVIGGVRIETNDLHLDLTVRGRLQRLKSKQGVHA